MSDHLAERAEEERARAAWYLRKLGRFPTVDELKALRGHTPNSRLTKKDLT